MRLKGRRREAEREVSRGPSSQSKTADALIIALATGLAASVYLGRWRLSALVLVGGLLARLVVLAVVWGVPRSVDTVVATSLAWLGPALVAVVFGLLARAASNRLRRQFSPVPNG